MHIGINMAESLHVDFAVILFKIVLCVLAHVIIFVQVYVMPFFGERIVNI